MGSDGKQQLVDHYCLWALLRALLHRSRWTAAIADQRASILADGTDQSRSASDTAAQLSESVSRQSSCTGNVCHTAYQPDACAQSTPAVRAGLGLQRAAVIRQGHVA